MLDHAIVGLDFSDATDQLIAELPRLARLGCTRLTLVHVLGGHYPQAPEVRHRAHYEARLAEEAERVEQQFAVATQVRIGDVCSELERAAAEQGGALLVVGSRGHTPWRDLFLGSTVLDLMRTSQLPVLLLPLEPGRPGTGGGMVLATDGSASAAGAERLVGELTDHLAGVAITVLDPDPRPTAGGSDPQAERARAHLDTLAGAGLETQVVRGPLPEAIARFADERSADLIVVGARGRNPLSGLLLGSTAEHLLRTAGRPVLVVRE